MPWFQGIPEHGRAVPCPSGAGGPSERPDHVARFGGLSFRIRKDAAPNVLARLAWA